MIINFLNIKKKKIENMQKIIKNLGIKKEIIEIDKKI
jgi:hypothetical protein